MIKQTDHSRLRHSHNYEGRFKNSVCSRTPRRTTLEISRAQIANVLTRIPKTHVSSKFRYFCRLADERLFSRGFQRLGSRSKLLDAAMVRIALTSKSSGPEVFCRNYIISGAF